MILLIDMGNQRLKWCRAELYADSEADGIKQCLAADNEAIAIDNIMSSGNDPGTMPLPWSGPAPEQVWISSVSRSDAADAVRRLCQASWGLEPGFVESPVCLGKFTNHYDRPSQLGVDRWLASLGAWLIYGGEHCSQPIVVIDAGTAVTVDVVADNGFCGGTILPGIALIADALGSRTGKIRLHPSPLVNREGRSHDSNMPQLPIECRDTAFATNSDDAVQAGAVASVAGGVGYCVDSVLSHFRESSNTGSAVAASIVICGGDAALVARAFPDSDATHLTSRVVPNLVLAGLYATARSWVSGDTPRGNRP